jgi:hypothetical protein
LGGSPLNARVDAVDDGSSYWRKERVSLDTSDGREQLPVNVFLPKNASPPYQTVIVFASAYALFARCSELLDYSRFDVIMRSGVPRSIPCRSHPSAKPSSRSSRAITRERKADGGLSGTISATGSPAPREEVHPPIARNVA